jgi:hypothetical protein
MVEKAAKKAAKENEIKEQRMIDRHKSGYCMGEQCRSLQNNPLRRIARHPFINE